MEDLMLEILAGIPARLAPISKATRICKEGQS